MTVAVTKNFAIHDFLKKNYGQLKLFPQENDLRCLLETSTKSVDAAVVNLAVASYLIENMGISNLRVAGYADYQNSSYFVFTRTSYSPWFATNTLNIRMACMKVAYRLNLGTLLTQCIAQFW